MALVHLHLPRRETLVQPGGKPHPALSLAIGFGVIVGAAMAVHTIFGMIF